MAVENAFAVGFLENIKVLFVGLLIYAIVFALLKKLEIFGDSKINSLIALLSAIIVSFTGVLTYAVSYAINWFMIIFFIIFLLMVLLMFLGVSFDDISKHATGNAKYIIIAFGVLFAIVVIKGFFALNNAYDVNNPPNSSYEIDTSFNTGIDDVTNVDLEEEGIIDDEWRFDRDLLSAVLFLLVVGGFVLLMGS